MKSFEHAIVDIVRLVISLYHCYIPRLAFCSVVGHCSADNIWLLVGYSTKEEQSGHRRDMQPDLACIIPLPKSILLKYRVIHGMKSPLLNGVRGLAYRQE